MKFCPDCGVKKPKEFYHKNKARGDGLQSVCKDCHKVRRDKWYRENKDHHNKWMRKHSYRNRPMYNARDSRRKAAEIGATVSWADEEQIKRIYKLCKKISNRTSVEHHVDHIIPLQGKTVCGLHVETNLAIIPKCMNLSKSNKFDNKSRSQTNTEDTPEEEEKD